MPRAFILALAALLTTLPAPTRAAGPGGVDSASQATMPPYYAALLASARRDSDSTLRHVVAMRAKWDEVLRQPESDAPPWFRDRVAGQPLGAVVRARIDAARARLPRDIAGAHADLESIRAILRDARTTHSVRTFDDLVTDYHDAIERLAARMGESHEIALNAEDFRDIEKHAERALAAWNEVRSFATPFKAAKGWARIDEATVQALVSTPEAARRGDEATAQKASRTVKDRYFDLLVLLASGT